MYKSFKYTTVLYRCENREYFKTIKDGAGDDIVIERVLDYETKRTFAKYRIAYAFVGIKIRTSWIDRIIKIP